MSIAVLILSAGRSSRMGDSKALLPWNGTTLLTHQCSAAIAADVGPVFAVLGHDAEHKKAHIPAKVHVIHNPIWQSGKVSSIQRGLLSVPQDVDGILLLSVDQPSLAQIICTVANELRHHDICVATHEGNRGHPIAFHSRMRPQLLALSEADRGVMALFKNSHFAIHSVDINHPSILWNFNTSEEYRNALNQQNQRESC